MSPIRIAITGGGVAGASMLHALLRYPHLDVHIFESAPAFKEAGVAFGYARNATAAMSLIGADARECLDKAGGVPMQGVRVFMAHGDDAGEMVFEADNEVQGKPTTTIVQRANLLREFLADAPEERMHASKKMENIDKQGDGSLLLHFKDRTTHECDILIGADGIHSTVRKIILGADDPAVSPRNSGMWAIMTLNPYEKARSSIGSFGVDIKAAREYGWVGKNIFMMHNILSHGEQVQFSITSHDEDAIGSDRWQKTLTRENLESLFVSKDQPSNLDKAIKELICDEPERSAMYLWEHPPAHTYVAGPICMMGDAAHATTPFQGAGGGQCVEDSLILSTLLGRASSQAEAISALKIYDQVRRPRTQRVVESSLETAKMIMGYNQDTGLDAEKLKTALKHRWDFIIDFDNKQHGDEAIQLYEAELKNASA